MTGQNSLNNFYQSVKFSNPRVAALLADDVLQVALNALGDDKSAGQIAADRLRRRAMENNLPEVLIRVLGNALVELGYS